MKFNFQRVTTPAYITSLALVVIGFLFALGTMAVVAWLFVILGIALNVMAVAVTAINDTPRAIRQPERSSVESGTRVVINPETDEEQQATPVGSASTAAAGATAPVKDEKPAKRWGSSSLRTNVASKLGSRSATGGTKDTHQVR